MRVTLFVTTPCSRASDDPGFTGSTLDGFDAGLTCCAGSGQLVAKQS
jgi:hypothetical protein